jgi:RNA polymerase sigma-70 factor (family 1)
MLPHRQLTSEDRENIEANLRAKDTPAGRVLSREEVIARHFETSPKRGFDMLFRSYYANLCSSAIRFVYSKDLAEDIVAEVFTNFWQNKAHENINTSYRAYLYKAVRFRAYNVIKYDLQRNTPLDDMQTLCFMHEPVLKPDDILQIHELTLKIDVAIKRLPPQARSAFQLHRLEGKKYAEIAIELGVSVSAIERLISRALIKLREDLKSEWVLSGLFFILQLNLP